ncbi:MAG TPA: gamma-glutamyltransferase [Acidimicrobiales bacterium]
MTAARGLVAAGEANVAGAAADVLAAGGNAFDAAVAAGFASAVAEPCLTSLGGGGFLLACPAAGDPVVVDFFVDTPGLGLVDRPDPNFEPVLVRFPGVDQEFVVGHGAAAVPGTLAGLLHAHRRLGRLPLDRVVAPAVALAERGVVVDEFQAYAASLLTPILTRTTGAAALFAPAGRLVAAGETFVNPDLAAFLAALPASAASFYGGDLAGRMAADMAACGGLLTTDDLAAYRVAERAPLATDVGDHRLLGIPPPSDGGTRVGGMLAAAAAAVLPGGAGWGSPDHAVALVGAMVAGEASGRVVTRGTTHVSVADAEGNVAAMTTSNGEGSGYVVPGTGILLNNMLGEDDLHPEGFHLDPPGHRLGSMMAPSVVLGPDGSPVLALGSGGSKRIRTAVFQVVLSVVALGLDVAEAVAAPRLHWDGTAVQAEPGWPAAAIAALRARWPVNEWDGPNMYFGGVHSVVPGGSAAADTRRGGATAATGDRP